MINTVKANTKIMSSRSPEPISLLQLPSSSQRRLGIAALYGMPGLSVDFQADPEGGVMWESLPDVSVDSFEHLTEQFRKDPVGVQRTFRDNMIAVATDERLTPEQRDRGLDAYIDASIDLTLRLDHSAFPPTPEGEVYTKPPQYFPDGFVNMGNSKHFTELYRNYEIVVLDKKETLDRYKPQIKEALLSVGSVSGSEEDRARNLLVAVGHMIYEDVTYSDELAADARVLGYGKLNLSEINDYVCRHQALIGQALLQTLGVTSGMVKSRVVFPGARFLAGESHMHNMVKLGDKWHIVDFTNPDFLYDKDGKQIWRPSIAPVPEPTEGTGLDAVYDVSTIVTGAKRRYELRHSSFRWYIQPPEQTRKQPTR